MPAERIAAVAEREKVDEVMMGVGRHPAWLRWVNPSIAQGVMELTDIPVTVLARGRAGAFERYALPAGLAGLAALLFAVDRPLTGEAFQAGGSFHNLPSPSAGNPLAGPIAAPAMIAAP